MNDQANGQDDAVLHMLRGATFGPDAGLTLPSGNTLSGDEAQIWTGLYADDDSRHRGAGEPPSQHPRGVFKGRKSKKLAEMREDAPAADRAKRV